MGEERHKDKIVVSNNTRFLSDVRNFISKMVGVSHIPSTEVNKVVLAVDEAVTNIMEHAYGVNEEGTIEIEVEVDLRQFRVYVRDSGKSFNPDEIKDVDMREHVKIGSKKGLGIFLMRQIMDEVRYQFKEGISNELLLVKYIPHGAE
ncbi:MAG: hypothetical protein A2Z34_05080 [Planctomycetes bacterium RBG_16_59_8]|nr:MAG: hypothetical protein A2Z34_05080 [Planctomycetes bacterium RBG_16_59_8]